MNTTASLPLYKRYVNGVPLPASSTRKTLRLREKYLLFLVVILFGFVCYVSIFLLPELKRGSKINKAYNDLRKAGEDVFFPRPQGNGVDEKSSFDIVKHNKINVDDQDPHLLEDKAKILRKIEENSNDVRDQVEKPNLKQKKSKLPYPNPSSHKIDDINNKKIPDNVHKQTDSEAKKNSVESADSIQQRWYKNIFGVNMGEPADEETKYKREFIKKMMKHAWDNYVRYAWGKNELRPISKTGHNPSIFGRVSSGATIVDALDTLYLMGLNDEFKQGRDWIASELNFKTMKAEISVFETNIRYVGGLLSCYALTGDEIFKVKAEEVAMKLLPAFKSSSGIPYAVVNTETGAAHNFGWANGGGSILSEFGTLHLEFTYLSNITGNPIYHEKVDKIRKKLDKMEKVAGGLYPNYLHPKTGRWGLNHVSIGALGDSFYEYLLKSWVQSNRTDYEAVKMFISAMTAMENKMLHHSRHGLTYLAEYRSNRLEHKMGHLACFVGGLYALAAFTVPPESNKKQLYLSIGENITHTCHESYVRSETKIGPEMFWFNEGNEARSLKLNERYYILRPEVIESYYVLWRLTKNPKYRQWGWDAAQAIEKHCRVDGGYSGIKDVYSAYPEKDDVQQSFFLAETLKYLYLLFSDDDLLPIDKWVMNSEAHPLPVSYTWNKQSEHSDNDV